MEPFERKITILDIVIISLAFVSLGLLIYEDVYHPTESVRRRIVEIDLVIVGAFALEYLYRLFLAKKKWSFVKRHWYDLIGMIPVSHPFFRAFRLARLFRIAAIASRFLRAADRSFGEAVVHRQLEKYRSILVEELTDPVLGAALAVTERALAKGNYGSAVARALEKNRSDLVERITAQMRKDTALALLMKTPGIGKGIEALPGRILDGVAETLDSPQMDRAIREIIQGILEDLKKEVAVKDWRRPSTPHAG